MALALPLHMHNIYLLLQYQIQEVIGAYKLQKNVIGCTMHMVLDPGSSAPLHLEHTILLRVKTFRKFTTPRINTHTHAHHIPSTGSSDSGLGVGLEVIF